MRSALRQPDLPEPVVPAISRCGIRARSVQTAAPEMSLPSQTETRARRRRQRLEDVAERDEVRREVRQLDADRLLAGDRREDADLGRRERVREVVLQRRDLRRPSSPARAAARSASRAGRRSGRSRSPRRRSARASARAARRRAPPSRPSRRSAPARCGGRPRRAACTRRAPTSPRRRASADPRDSGGGSVWSGAGGGASVRRTRSRRRRPGSAATASTGGACDGAGMAAARHGLVTVAATVARP